MGLITSPFFLHTISEYLDVFEFKKIVDVYPEIAKYSYNNIKYNITTNDIETMELLIKYFNKVTFNTVDDCYILPRIRSAQIKRDKILLSIVRFSTQYFQMTNKDLKYLPNLADLAVNNNFNISNKCIKKLTKLTTLRLQNKCPYITQQICDHITNLTALQLFNTTSVTDIKKLTKLVSLNLSCNTTITEKNIENLTNMTHLGLWNNIIITGAIFKKMTNITSLNLDCNELITDNDIENITELTALSLMSNNKITNKGLNKLTKLVHLELRNNYVITEECIRDKTNLTHLSIVNFVTKNDTLNKLTNLISLNISENNYVTNDAIKHLTKLTHLDIKYTDKIT